MEETTKSTIKPSRQNPGRACQQCRMRKLRCDRQKPCSGCVDSGLACHTSSVAPQRGPKRGHLKDLRSRIIALEQTLGGQDLGLGLFTPAASESQFSPDENSVQESAAPPLNVTEQLPSTEGGIMELTVTDPSQLAPYNVLSDKSYVEPTGLSIPPLIRADLDQLFFDRVNLFLPIIQQYRYFKRSRDVYVSSSHICLRYAMWTMAVTLSSQFHHLRDMLYHHTLERLDHSPTEDDESRLEHTQAWILIAVYELMQAPFQRAWISVGRAIRLVQLIRLNEIDKVADPEMDTDACIKREEKRRTFWMAFCLDRCSCILEGLPLTLNEQEISTRLPSTEDDFQSGTRTTMPFLSEVLTMTDSSSMSPFAESIIFTTLWGRSFKHHRQSATENEFNDVSRDFFQRQIQLSGILNYRIQKFQQDHVTALVKTDAMLLYTSLVAQATALLLCQAAECIPPTTPNNHGLVLSHGRRGPEIVKEIVLLAQYLPHFNLFKIHPFTPIPLYLCWEFLVVLRDHDGFPADNINVISEALQELKGVNTLCQSRLGIDFTEMELADLEDTPEMIRDLFGSY